MTRRNIYLFSLSIMLLLSFGCGGGGGGGPAANMAPSTTRAVISFSLISTATLPVRLSGVQIQATLPNALTVATTGPDITSRLEAGSATSSSITGIPVSGSYLPPNLINLIILDSTQAGFGPGEMARLTCSIAAGTTISENDRLALQNNITFIASGWDATPNLISLNGFLTPRVTITYPN